MVLFVPSSVQSNFPETLTLFKLIHPFINFAHASVITFSDFLLAGSRGDDSAKLLWQSALENQARFINEYTDALLDTLAQSRETVNGQVDKLHKRSEHVATQLAHSTVRAVAIATQARREKRDRRLFPLPLPAERRVARGGDRRTPPPLATYHAGL